MSPSVSVRLLLTQSDERLMGYARAGHERAFEALVERYRRQLHRYCRRLLLSDERAEDALQQALLQAWVALRDGAEVYNVRPWLYRIVHNAAVNALRVSGYDYCTLNESLSGADAPQSDLDRRIAVREALAGLAALPEMQREALLRTAMEGHSHQRVASDLGLSEPAVRGLVYRARTTLRAAAGAIVPPPLLSWALEAGTRGTPALESVAGLGAGGGAVGLAGLLVKGSAVAVTAGALAGGIVASHSHEHHVRTGEHPSAQIRPGRTVSRASSTDAYVHPVAFTQPSGTHHRHNASLDGQDSKRLVGQPYDRRSRRHVNTPLPFVPAPSPSGSDDRTDNVGANPQDGGPRPAFGEHEGRHYRGSSPYGGRDSGRDGGGSTSQDGGGEPSQGGDSGGERASQDGSGSTSPEHGVSTDGPGGQTSNDGESSGKEDQSSSSGESTKTSGGSRTSRMSGSSSNGGGSIDASQSQDETGSGEEESNRH